MNRAILVDPRNQAGVIRNHVLNPRPTLEATTGTVEVARNYATHPRPTLTSGTVEARRNRIANPSFEVDLTGVQFGTQTTLTRSTTSSGSVGPAFGSAFMALAGSATPDVNQSYALQWLDGTVNPGDFVAVALRARRSGSGVMFMRTMVQFYNGSTFLSQAHNGWQPLLNDPLASTTTRHVFVSPVAPATTTRARMLVWFAKDASGTAGDAGWAAHTDGWQAATSTSDTAALALVDAYYDGGITIDPLLTPSWTGTAGLSASILTGSRPVRWTTAASVNPYMVTDGGEPVVEVQSTINVTPYVFTGAADAGPTAPAVGKWLALGVDVKPLNAQAASLGRLHLRTQSGGTNLDGSYSPVGQGFVEGEWRRVVHAIQVVTPGADNVDGFVWPATLPPGIHYRARRSVVAYADTEAQARAVAATYFDGATTTDTALVASWSGTVNGSESVLSGRIPNLWSQSSGNIRYLSTVNGNMVVTIANQDVSRPSNVVFGDNLTAIPVGWWVAAAADVTATDATTAASMRMAILDTGGATVTGSPYAAQPVTSGVEQRISHARQVTALPGGAYLRAVVYPETVPLGAVYHVRRAVVAIAPTQAEARDIASFFFDGDSRWAAWDGVRGASTSRAHKGFVRT